VDCGALVPTLIESELFGYVKGAFTGATHAKEGLLAIADGGTVFLDEVGELPLDLQAKILRVLQEKEIRPVGSTKQVPINVRILAATNRDLEQAVAQGAFRRDLYFRLNVLNLRIPPLRERRQDIPALVSYFLERLSREGGTNYELSDEAMSALFAYDWPGNVRELENCIERCCALNSGPTIHVTDLHSSITGASRQRRTETPETRIVPIADLEQRAILCAIEQLNGDKLTAAKLLGIGKTTLYRKLKEYGSSSVTLG
jgi:two-component system response regulator HydG